MAEIFHPNTLATIIQLYWINDFLPKSQHESSLHYHYSAIHFKIIVNEKSIYIIIVFFPRARF